MSKVFNMVGGGGGPSASIFVTGLSETDTVTATNGSKTLNGEWSSKVKIVEAMVPTMTSNTTPSGECFAKSELDATDCYTYLAFSGSPVSGKQAHSISGDAQGWWVGYDFGYSVKIEYFEICPQFTSNNTYWKRLAQTLTLQGSNDGSIWEDIQSFTRTDKLTDSTSYDTHEILKFAVDNPVTYRMYRVVWTTLTPTSDGYASCSYVQFVGTKIVELSGHLISPIRDFRTWSVTATDGTNTLTKDVLVDVITEYVIEMDLSKLWLYRDGDECENITGGWSTENYSFAGSDGTKYSTYLLCQSTTNKVAQIFAVQNKIDFTPYTKLYVELDITLLTDYGRVFIQACENRNPQNTFRIDRQVTTTGKQIVEIDAPNYELYLFVLATDQSATVKFTKVWLEK